MLLEGNAELSAIASVVRAAGELDETPAVVANAVARVDVAETGAILVVPREVLRSTELVDRLERAHLRADRGEDGNDALPVGEAVLDAGRADCRPMTLHVVRRRVQGPRDYRRRQIEGRAPHGYLPSTRR